MKVLKKILIIITLVCCILLISTLINNRSEPIMKYFPIDNDHYFEKASTTISYLSNSNKNNVIWQTKSTSNGSKYLRQDVSILYGNGKFKGIQQKWIQDASKIILEKSFKVNKPSLLQAISFHHGEIHHEDETINSIQKMTYDQFFYLGDHQQNDAPQNEKSKHKTKLTKKINNKIHQFLSATWDDWLAYYQINEDDYELVPLLEIIEFQDHPIGNYSMAETEQIVGQLWEGLYENYITLLINEQEKKHHPMPVVLLAKDDSHLMVLYEINSKKTKLIQQLPKSEH